MKRIYFFALMVISAACETKPDYDPSSYLDVKEKNRLHLAIVRNIGKLPEKATDSTKMDKQYDEYYLDLASKHQLKNYFISDNGQHFFLEWRQAPSLHEKYVATGGKLRVDKEGNVLSFEEVFRTWKLQPDTLSKRALLLFDKMVKGQSLKEFETIHSKGTEFIEFPDENVFYDTASRTWRSRKFKSVEEMVEDTK